MIVMPGWLTLLVAFVIAGDSGPIAAQLRGAPLPPGMAREKEQAASSAFALTDRRHSRVDEQVRGCLRKLGEQLFARRAMTAWDGRDGLVHPRHLPPARCQGLSGLSCHGPWRGRPRRMRIGACRAGQTSFLYGARSPFLA